MIIEANTDYKQGEMVAIYSCQDGRPPENPIISTIGYLISMTENEVILARQHTNKEMEDFVHIPMKKVFQYGKLQHF